MNLSQHPLSAAFPGMSDIEFQGLIADIGQRGQRDKIVIYDGQVLDGWHRYQACNELGIPARKKPLPEGVDPVAFVKSYNLHRRHLSASQRAEAVVACTEWAKVGSNQHGGYAPGAEATTSQMAKDADVSPRTISHAKTAHASGLGEKVRDGELSAKKAAEIAKPPKSKPEPPPPEPTPEWMEEEETISIPKSLLAEYEADAKALEAVLDADDKLAEATKQIKMLTSQVDGLRSQMEGANNKNNQLISDIKRLNRQVVKLQKEIETMKMAGLPI
jgi:hypothetical protein